MSTITNDFEINEVSIIGGGTMTGVIITAPVDANTDTSYTYTEPNTEAPNI
jgi:hypothetical protein